MFENYPVDQRTLAADEGGLRPTGVSGHSAPHYPLSLTAAPGERLQLRLNYRPDLFDRASVEAMAGRLVRLLEATVADPERAVGSLDLLTLEERHTILHKWNETAHAVPSATLPELFAAQVATHARRGCGGVRGAEPQLMPSSMRAPISWRIICADLGVRARDRGRAVRRALARRC